MFVTLLAALLLSMGILNFLFQSSAPAGWSDIITIVVGFGLTLALKLGPIPSRIVAAVGALAALYGTFGDKVIGLFPAGSRVPVYIAIFGAVILAISERIQGGITIPEKRTEAAKAENKGETF